MKVQASVKHLQIAKANNLMFIVVALASVLIVFSLISAKTLMGVSSYQHKALKAKHDAIKKLQANIKAADALKKQYDTFENQNPNVLGGVGGKEVAEAIATQGEGAGSIKVNGQTINLSGQDGDNAKIILDALPSSYDFPALISSMEKIANQDHIPLQGVGGTDQGSTAATEGTGTTAAHSQPVAIPFSLSAQTDYNTIKILINDMERSIRPMDLTTISFSGNGNSMNVSFQLNTYYQFPTSLQITQKEITK
jgi:cell division protein FtsB